MMVGSEEKQSEMSKNIEMEGRMGGRVGDNHAPSKQRCRHNGHEFYRTRNHTCGHPPTAIAGPDRSRSSESNSGAIARGRRASLGPFHTYLSSGSGQNLKGFDWAFFEFCQFGVSQMRDAAWVQVHVIHASRQNSR